MCKSIFLSLLILTPFHTAFATSSEENRSSADPAPLLQSTHSSGGVYGEERPEERLSILASKKNPLSFPFFDLDSWEWNPEWGSRWSQMADPSITSKGLERFVWGSSLYTSSFFWEEASQSTAVLSAFALQQVFTAGFLSKCTYSFLYDLFKGVPLSSLTYRIPTRGEEENICAFLLPPSRLASKIGMSIGAEGPSVPLHNQTKGEGLYRAIPLNPRLPHYIDLPYPITGFTGELPITLQRKPISYARGLLLEFKKEAKEPSSLLCSMLPALTILATQVAVITCVNSGAIERRIALNILEGTFLFATLCVLWSRRFTFDLPTIDRIPITNIPSSCQALQIELASRGPVTLWFSHKGKREEPLFEYTESVDQEEIKAQDITPLDPDESYNNYLFTIQSKQGAPVTLKVSAYAGEVGKAL